jgi:quinol monooxygenase YgiN
MNVVLAGTVRFPPERMAEARERMREMMRLSRAEDGCIEYVYSEDLIEPGLVHVFEIWRDEAALHGHHTAPHFLAWRASRDEIGMHDRRMRRYDVASSKDI